MWNKSAASFTTRLSPRARSSARGWKFREHGSYVGVRQIYEVLTEDANMIRARHFAPLGCAALLIAAFAGCRRSAQASGAMKNDTSAANSDSLTDAAIAGIVITDNSNDSTGGAF